MRNKIKYSVDWVQNNTFLTARADLGECGFHLQGVGFLRLKDRLIWPVLGLADSQEKGEGKELRYAVPPQTHHWHNITSDPVRSVNLGPTRKQKNTSNLNRKNLILRSINS